MDLLDPLEVDHRHDSDLEVGVLGDVDAVGDDGAVKALVEQQVGIGRHVAPGGERSGRRAELLGLLGIVDVGARLAGAGLAIGLEDGFQLGQQVGLGAEMTEVVVACLLGLGHRLLHAGTVEAVEGIALDEGGGDVLAAEDLLERLLHRRGARARGTGDGNDGMLDRHDVSKSPALVLGIRRGTGRACRTAASARRCRAGPSCSGRCARPRCAIRK